MPASSVSVRFPTYGTQEFLPRGIRIVQEEYKHDLAVYIVRAGKQAYAYKTGTPIRISWAEGRNVSDFFGYVHHIEPTENNDVLVWSRGASSTLDNGAQTIFQDRTVTSVVREVAQGANFDVQAAQHGQVFDSLTATGGRLWRLLVDSAQEIGYSFYAHNTRLMLHPRLQTVQQYKDQAPVLRSAPGTSDHSLLEFRPSDGHSQPGKMRSNRVIHGVNPRTGGSFSITGGVMQTELGRTTTMPNGVVYENIGSSTPEEARWKLAAMAENDRFNITATARATGDPRVHQTWPIIVAGTGETYEGLWFVRKVVHNISDPEYTMDLSLGKDGRGSTVPIPDPRARRVVATRDNPQGRPKAVFPPTTLVNGVWRAQWSAATRTFVDTSQRVSR